MKNKLLLITITFSFLLFLAIPNVTAELGCCYEPSISGCSDIDSSLCSGATDVFYSGQLCDDVPECDVGCCCESPRIYPERKGVCEQYGGSFLPIGDETQCISVCSSNLPPCLTDCGFNTGNCTGKYGEIVPAGRYYCWDNGQSYTNYGSCDNACNPLA